MWDIRNRKILLEICLAQGGWSLNPGILEGIKFLSGGDAEVREEFLRSHSWRSGNDVDRGYWCWSYNSTAPVALSVRIHVVERDKKCSKSNVMWF